MCICIIWTLALILWVVICAFHLSFANNGNMISEDYGDWNEDCYKGHCIESEFVKFPAEHAYNACIFPYFERDPLRTDKEFIAAAEKIFAHCELDENCYNGGTNWLFVWNFNGVILLF